LPVVQRQLDDEKRKTPRSRPSSQITFRSVLRLVTAAYCPLPKINCCAKDGSCQVEARPTIACTATLTNLDVSTVEARVADLITKWFVADRRRRYRTWLVLRPTNSVACSIRVKLAAALLDLEEASRCRRYNSRSRVKTRSPGISAVWPCRSIQRCICSECGQCHGFSRLLSSVVVWRQLGDEKWKLLGHVDSQELFFHHVGRAVGE
jgi:hypothetical protein